KRRRERPFPDPCEDGGDGAKTPNPPHRVCHGVFRRHPRREVVARPHLDVEPQFVLYLMPRRLAPNGRAQTAQNGSDGRHGESPLSTPSAKPWRSPRRAAPSSRSRRRVVCAPRGSVCSTWRGGCFPKRPTPLRPNPAPPACRAQGRASLPRPSKRLRTTVESSA